MHFLSRDIWTLLYPSALHPSSALLQISCKCIMMHPDKDGWGQKPSLFPYCFFLMPSSDHNNNIHGILEHGTGPSQNKLRPEVLTPLIRSSYDEAKCWTNHWLQ